MSVIYVMIFFLKISNANNAVLYAVLPASIVFILLTITATHKYAESFENFPPILHHKIFRFEMKFSEIFPAVIYFAISNPLNLTSQSAHPTGPPYVASRRVAVRAKARFRVHLFRLEPSKK